LCVFNYSIIMTLRLFVLAAVAHFFGSFIYIYGSDSFWPCFIKAAAKNIYRPSEQTNGPTGKMF